jgi:formamidopyrimidine-DNA glycosylase
MPELPEVEVTRRSFADRITGAVVEGVRLGKPLRWSLGVAPARLEGQQVLGVRRRGKYLLMDLSGGLLLWHLGMSGSLRFEAALPPPGPHDHVDLQTNQGCLRLHDPRRFGAVVWAEGEADPVARKLLGHLGVEPLEAAFEPKAFHGALRQRRAPIKQVLLAGDVVVGVGNIYASETLFLAGIRPTTAAQRLSLARATRLHAAIQRVLAQAVAQGGSTLKDFTNAMGESGHFQQAAMVYDRAGLPCRVCATPVRVLRQGQRSTFFCPTCQRP